jgi:2',3'-cyclic-nucleotide 2'-phosphodiesterase (5'-nucleotidase family)
MNSMGFDADGLGNHNFDKGEQYLRNTLIPLAKFPFLSANIVDSAGRTPREWSPSKVFNFEGGKLGLIGFSNEDIRFLTFPGSLGPFHVDPATAAVNAEAARLKAQGVNAIVAMGHLGADGPTTLRPNGSVIGPFGPLLSLADGVTNVDAVIGDHTNFQVLERRPNGVLVTENLSKGVRFTRLRLVIDTNDKTVVYKTADFHKPWTIGVTANAAIQKRLDELNAIIAPILGVHVASSATPIPRSDSCGRADGRLCESKIGDVITDSMRTAFKADFPSFNVDFAITNSGGIRDSLTCPTTDLQGDFCLASLYPFAAGVFPITKGQVVTVLPFGNVVATAPVTGVQLKDMLENGVANVPGANGRFAQVSGLCFTYDISRTARTVTPNPVPGSGDRVTSVVRANPDGTCTATPVGLTSSDHYTVAVNDFMAFGGDAYPNLVSALNTPSVKTMDSVLEAFVAAKSPPATSPPALNPVIQGRITCVDGNGATAPNCSTVLP